MSAMRIALSAVLLAFPAAAPAQDITPYDPVADGREFQPGLLREWSRNSIRILETYRDYKDDFRQYRSKRYDSASRSLVDKVDTWFIMGEWDLMQPILRNGKTYSRLKAVTDRGNLAASIQKNNGALLVSYLARDWEAGAYAIVDDIDLRAEEKDNLFYPELFEDQDGEGMLIFPAGYMIFAGYRKWKDWTVDAGVLLKSAPLTTRDTSGKEIFRLRRRDDSVYTGADRSYGVFLDVGKGGYSLNTLLSLEDKLETLGLSLPAFGLGGFTLAPYVRYQAHRSRYQAGAELRRTFFRMLGLSIDAAGDVHRNSAGRFEAFHHAVFGPTLTLFALAPEKLHTYRRRDFQAILGADVSVSSDVLDETVYGYAASITFQDMGGVVSWRSGIGYNDWRYLRMFPERDALGMNIMLRLAF